MTSDSRLSRFTTLGNMRSPLLLLTQRGELWPKPSRETRPVPSSQKYKWVDNDDSNLEMFSISFLLYNHASMSIRDASMNISILHLTKVISMVENDEHLILIKLCSQLVGTIKIII